MLSCRLGLSQRSKPSATDCPSPTARQNCSTGWTWGNFSLLGNLHCFFLYITMDFYIIHELILCLWQTLKKKAKIYSVFLYPVYSSLSSIHLGPEHTGHFVQPHLAAHCGGDIYSRRKPLFSSFGEHTAVCGSSVPQAVARPRHRQSVCIHNIHVAATCRPSVLGSATMRGQMWLNKVASVLGPL